MKPNTLTTGAVTSVPFSRESAGSRISRRMISTPFSSSPWIAAHTSSTGPSARPWTTCTGMVSSVCV